MAQSNSNESNVRGIPSFWQNHTVDPPIPWEEWSDLFQLAIIAKENIDIENLLNPTERYHPPPPTLENPPKNESDAQKTSRIESNIQEQKRFNDEEMASIKLETKKFNGMRLEEADKKTKTHTLSSPRKRRKENIRPEVHKSQSSTNFFQRILGQFVHSFCEKNKHNLRKTQTLKQKTEGQRIIRTILGGTGRNGKTM